MDNSGSVVVCLLTRFKKHIINCYRKYVAEPIQPLVDLFLIGLFLFDTCNINLELKKKGDTMKRKRQSWLIDVLLSGSFIFLWFGYLYLIKMFHLTANIQYIILVFLSLVVTVILKTIDKYNNNANNINSNNG